MDSDKRKLLTLFIRHESDFKSLSKKALSQIILKYLYFREGPTSLNKLIKGLNSTFNCNLKKGEVLKALEPLIESDKVKSEKKTYSINSEAKEKIQNIEGKYTRELEDIISYWFGKSTLKNDVLMDWFEELVIRFFNSHSLELLGTITSKGFSNGSFNNISNIVKNSFSNFPSIQDEEKIFLTKKFEDFLSSDRPIDQSFLLRFSSSLFAATLLHSRMFADQISFEEFSNSTLILDTNILIRLSLDKQEMHESIQLLEKLFFQFKIKPATLRISVDEYERTIYSKYIQIKKYFEEFSIPILSKMRDFFVTSALRLGCETADDVDRLFENVKNGPKYLADASEINLLDNPELCEIIRGGQENEKLVNEILSISKDINKEKRMTVCRHDAGLISAVEYLRERNNKTWILTDDSVIVKYAAKHAVRDQSPCAISFSLLINLIVISSEPEEVEEGKLARIFSSIIKNSLHPEEDSFEKSEIAILLSSAVKISDLEDAKVLELISEIKKQRISGTSEEDIGLFIRKSFEKERISSKGEADQLRIRLEEEREMRKSAEDDVNKANISLKDLLESKYKNRLWWGIAWRLVLYYLIIPLLIFFLSQYLFDLESEDSKKIYTLYSILITIFGELILSLLYSIKNIKNFYKTEKEEIRIKIEKSLVGTK